MKVSTKLMQEGKTSIVPLNEKTVFPVTFEIFVERYNETLKVRQYILVFSWRENSFQVVGECVEEVLWKFGKLLLALLGENT